MPIYKGVIVCAGLGTRSLPITKVLPKELTPILNKPCLDYIIDEMISSGIKDILIIISPHKKIIKKYFERSPKLYNRIKDNPSIVKKYTSTIKDAHITYAYQPEPRGSGDALRYARDFAGEDPFCVSWGDEIIISKKPAIQQLIDCYDHTKKCVLGLKNVSRKNTVKYGIVHPLDNYDKYLICDKIIEKPSNNPPSTLASVGRYIFDPMIFDILDRLPYDHNGELPLTDAINDIGSFCGCVLSGKRFDIATPHDLYTLTRYEYNKLIANKK